MLGGVTGHECCVWGVTKTNFIESKRDIFNWVKYIYSLPNLNLFVDFVRVKNLLCMFVFVPHRGELDAPEGLVTSRLSRQPPNGVVVKVTKLLKSSLEQE